MSLNSTPSGERVQITFFGRTNAGKSSLINAFSGQELSLTSHISGTTTDPVKKAMELLPLGPVVIVDTPGLDDNSELGSLRIKKTFDELRRTDIAVLVIDANVGKSKTDEELIEKFKSLKIPFVVCYNKSDEAAPRVEDGELLVSAIKRTNIDQLKTTVASLIKGKENNKKLISDLVELGDVVVLVIPIDKSAPKGRLILPQQQTIRDLLDAKAITVVVGEEQLPDTITTLGDKIKIVVCDSQIFKSVEKEVPKNIFLTSFSILFARYKGELAGNLEGAKALDSLRDGDRILISEGCTHHRQCGDIGRDKIPSWIREYSKKDLEFSFTSGGEFPSDLSGYKMVIHCGGCMLTETEVKARMRIASDEKVPFSNYGMIIAKTNGILDRAIEVFNNNF